MVTHLVDSDRVIEHLKGVGAGDLFVRSSPRGSLAISVVSYAEVWEGVIRARHPAEQRRIFEAFISSVFVLRLTVSIAERFGELRAQLRRTGNLIPDTDLFIAATALQHRLTLVTGNVRHFGRVPGLAIEGS